MNQINSKHKNKQPQRTKRENFSYKKYNNPNANSLDEKNIRFLNHFKQIKIDLVQTFIGPNSIYSKFCCYLYNKIILLLKEKKIKFNSKLLKAKKEDISYLETYKYIKYYIILNFPEQITKTLLQSFYYLRHTRNVLEHNNFFCRNLLFQIFLGIKHIKNCFHKHASYILDDKLNSTLDEFVSIIKQLAPRTLFVNQKNLTKIKLKINFVIEYHVEEIMILTTPLIVETQ